VFLRVLLCDDHVLFCEALQATLRQQDHDVETAHHPDDAVDRIGRHCVDAVVMDLGFPDGDAVAAIRKITTSAQRTPVVVLTATVESRALLAAIDAGAVAICSKSQRLTEVVRAIEGAHRRGPKPGADTVVQLLRRLQRPDEHRLGNFLTPREFEVLGRLVRGQNTHAIANDLGVSYSTSRTHIQGVLTKLGVHSRLEAAAFAVRNHLVDGS
jgi:two-component system nitrate/nitrite response regulator NarL